MNAKIESYYLFYLLQIREFNWALKGDATYTTMGCSTVPTFLQVRVLIKHLGTECIICRMLTYKDKMVYFTKPCSWGHRA